MKFTDDVQYVQKFMILIATFYTGHMYLQIVCLVLLPHLKKTYRPPEK